jgi:hypothetical protein
MEFIQLTSVNASKYVGNNVVFHLNSIPVMAKLIGGEKNQGFILEMDGGRHLLSYKSIAYIIENKEDLRQVKTHLYFTMNFVLLTPINVLQYVGYPVIVKNKGLNKIRGVHKTKTYISVKNGTKEMLVYFNSIPCYVII